MKLIQIQPPRLELTTSWLAQKENYQWLDFGRGKQQLDTLVLKLMTQQSYHCLRLFTDSADELPIGLVALSDISVFKTATLWYLLGDKRFAGQNCTTEAVAMMLELGFGSLDLRVIQAWTVSTNHASRKVLEKNGFRPIGVQRQCHIMDGVTYDRHLFDKLNPKL